MAVELTLDGNRPQRRVTVAFRVILAIPHWIFASVLGAVAMVVIFFAWFAVLFTAHMPRGMGDFLARILQYQARVYAYGQFLLTDRYPSFDLGPSGYPVELEIPEPGRFNRAAVLFRAILQLFALLVSQLVTGGATVILVFVWLVTLISGSVPTSAYLALSSILRYQLRTWAYIGMLTTDYPRGLFGDRDDDAIVGAPVTVPVEDVDVDALPASPRVNRLVLSSGSKALVVLALVLGAGWQAISIATADFSFTFGTSARLADAAIEFDHAYDTWADRARLCRQSSTPECQRTANASLRFAIQHYEAQLRDIVPADDVRELAAVNVHLEAMAGYLGEMTEAGADDRNRLTLQVEDEKFLYDRAYDDLFNAVTFD